MGKGREGETVESMYPVNMQLVVKSFYVRGAGQEDLQSGRA